jgi:hypothetical protein
MNPELRSVSFDYGRITFRIPAAWTEVSTATKKIVLREVNGGEFSASLRDFQKPIVPGTTGLTSEEMVRKVAGDFGGITKVITSGRAISSHATIIGEPGHEKACQAWHLVNQVGPWHHELLLFMYQSGDVSPIAPELISLLDRELSACTFAIGSTTSNVVHRHPTSKPWWRFW